MAEVREEFIYVVAGDDNVAWGYIDQGLLTGTAVAAGGYATTLSPNQSTTPDTDPTTFEDASGNLPLAGTVCEMGNAGPGQPSWRIGFVAPAGCRVFLHLWCLTI